MAHKRKEIRSALKAMLLNNTSAGTNVQTNRAYNIDKERLPLIHIRDGNEDATPRDMGIRRYIRRFRILIDVKVTKSTGADEELDELCKQIEELIHADPTLNGSVSGTVYISTDEPDFEIGEQTTGSTTLTYEVQYLS